MPYQTGWPDRVIASLAANSLAGLVRVAFVAGWETRGSSTFTPKGIVAHHDASSVKADPAAILRLHVSGREGLPGPVCHADLSRRQKDGRYILSVIAAGRANHAGVGAFRGLTGNSELFGLEISNTGLGDEPWPDDQLAVAAAVFAGWLDHMGCDATWQTEHKLWGRPLGRKVDRYGLDQADMQRRTQQALDRLHAAAAPAPAPVSAVSTSEEDDMIFLARTADTGAIWACYPGTRERIHLVSSAEVDMWRRGLGRGVADLGDVSYAWLGQFNEVVWDLPNRLSHSRNYAAVAELPDRLDAIGSAVEASVGEPEDTIGGEPA